MSVNIQTSSGLLKISGDRVTKENINKALGYTPANVDELPDIRDDDSASLVIADPSGNIGTKIDGDGIKTIEDVTIKTSSTTHSVVAHIEDSTRHITAAERSSWNDRSYQNLTGAPDIKEDESGKLQIADTSGNVILAVDENGLTTHDVRVSGSSESVSEHQLNPVSHVTASDRNKWDNKSDFSGNYVDLVGEPHITEDESAQLHIADSSGNIIATISEAGVRSCEFIVGETAVGQTLQLEDARIGTLESTVGITGEYADVVPLTQKTHDHVNDTDIHIQSGERDKWDTAASTVDSINKNYATNTAHEELKAKVDNHITDSTDKLHVTSDEKLKWNNKSDFSGNYVDLIGEPDIFDDESEQLEIADEAGYVIMRLDKESMRVFRLVIGPETESDDSPVYDVAEQLKSNTDTLTSHITDATSKLHVSSAEKTLWNGKTDLNTVRGLGYALNSDLAEVVAEVDTHIGDDTHITPTERSNWNSAYNHISDTTKHITATERSNWNALIATHESDVNSINRKLIEIGDLKEVESSFVTNYTISSGKASATVEAHMFENFYIHPTDTYNVSVTYDEWAGTVCEQRILAENTGAHIVTVSRKDGADVTSSELNTIKTIVEHIKTGFSIYFNKLYNIVQGNNDILEENLTFDTTTIITQE